MSQAAVWDRRRLDTEKCREQARGRVLKRMPGGIASAVLVRLLEKILWGDGQLSIGRLGSGHLDQEAPHGICRDARITC